MSTDTDIWERACERAGVWKRNEKRFRYNRYFATENEYTVSAPPLGDPAAAIKMLATIIARAREEMENGTISPSSWVRFALNLFQKDTTTPLALAHAVCALPEEHQP